MVSLRGLTLTAARPRIIVPLFARDPAALCPLAKAASADPAAELIELRLDPLPADEFLNALALGCAASWTSRWSSRSAPGPRAVSLP